jgi:hypothetical protein
MENRLGHNLWRLCSMSDEKDSAQQCTYMMLEEEQAEC